MAGDQTIRERRPPGRPRDTRVHQAVLDAAIDLLAEEGWGGLTMERVAARARTAKGTVYRWWSSKEELVIEALMVHTAPYRPAPDTGSFRGDLVAILEGMVAYLREPRARALSSLIFEASRNGKLWEVLRHHLVGAHRANMMEAIGRAQARGELRDDVDVEALFDAGSAQIVYRYLVTHEPLTDDLPERLADFALRGAARRPGEPG